MRQIGLCGLLAALVLPGPEKPAPAPTLVYVGTYARDEGKGIHLFRLQPEGTEVFQNVTLVPLGLAADTPNPSFLEVDAKRRLLFAVNEIDEFEGRPTGAVSAFSIDAAGKLTLLSQRPSQGKSPSHLVLDHTGRHLLVANAASGSVAVFPVAADGRLGEPAASVAQPPPIRGVAFDPASRFAFVCHLAQDKVLAYRFDAETGALAPGPPSVTALKPGTGPRRLLFRPDGRFAYVAGETSSTVTVFAYDAGAGALREVQTVSTLPEYFDGPNTAAEMVVHPTGKYLYVSNRGHNSIVLFGVDPDAGTLTYVEEQGTGGKTPRHFGLEASGKHLAVVNQESDTVLASRVDVGNGRLKPSGIFASVASPACVTFLAPPEPAP